jgi:DNA-binding NtrC family response regulator
MTHRILVVDDEDDVRSSLCELLRTLPDVTVESARNFAEGTVKASSKDWDLVISDERMPDGNGTDLLRRIALTKPAVRLVLMSAHQDFGMAVRAINHGRVDEFMEKPWDPEGLLERIRLMLQETPQRAAAGDPSLQLRTFRRIGGPASSPPGPLGRLPP